MMVWGEYVYIECGNKLTSTESYHAWCTVNQVSTADDDRKFIAFLFQCLKSPCFCH